jgi:hypothetical protein
MRTESDKTEGEGRLVGREEKQMVDPPGQGLDRAEGGWQRGMVHRGTALTIFLIVEV